MDRNDLPCMQLTAEYIKFLIEVKIIVHYFTTILPGKYLFHPQQVFREEIFIIEFKC